MRTALLIGVPFYKYDDFPTIPTVANDLHQLRLVLESSGYEGNVRVYPEGVESKGSENILVTGAMIKHELRRACQQAPGGSTLFLYFSGHGMGKNRRDYLVPGDVPSLEEIREDVQFLVDTDLGPYLEKCDARAVIFAIDACRENVGQPKGFQLIEPPEFGSAALDQKNKTRLAVIYGCDRRQYCYTSDELKMSLFTKALCTVLSPEHPAQRLSEVVTAVDKALTGLVDKHRPGRVQRVHALYETADGVVDDTPICDGSADSWRIAVRGSTLWRLAGDTDPKELESFKSLAESIADEAWSQWQAVVTELPEDPWRDPDYAVRCLSALELLVPDGSPLSIAEIVTLTAAPFLAEVVHTEGVNRLRKRQPLNLSAGVSLDPLRQELEAVHSAHPRIRDKAIALEKDRPTDAATVATWLMHRHIFRQVRLWEEPPVDALSRKLAVDLDRRTGFRNECARAVLGISSLLATGAEELEAFLEGSAEGVRVAASKVTAQELPSGRRSKIRGPMLAVLLSIAGSLAFDPRRLGEVVVDHIGIRDALDPAELRRAVHEAKWTLSDDRTTIGLEARCVHPAIHLALQEACAGVQQHLQAAHRWSRKTRKDDVPVAALPVSVSTDELQPESVGGKQLYETPLLQFRLAHNEVRDLLMGVQLYGDPALAIRELYQNALDACRYRRVRATYRNRAYDGSIRIVQGDEDGRPYIECIDNGVGMGRRELETTFSRAGRRFATSTAFLWEQAEWQRHNESLRLYPNSQFGIGVFSYFMLADEIFVETAQVDPVTDAPLELLHVRISSSGSLFRITTAHEPHNPIATTGGTRVRLYLREPMATEISCIETLDKLLWYSEFNVEATDGRARRQWSAGVLKPPGNVGTWVHQAAPDIWWIGDKGVLLADGIATNETPFGYVVNLCRENRPTLSIDRNRLEGWNEAWVEAQLRAAAAVLPDIRQLDFWWLQQLAGREKMVVQRAVADLLRRDAVLPVNYGQRSRARIGDVGVWPIDIELNASSYSRGNEIYFGRLNWNAQSNYLIASRRKVWMQAGITDLVRHSDTDSMDRFTAGDIFALPADTGGHPLLEPLDHALMTAGLSELIKISYQNHTELAVLVRRIRRFIIHGAFAPPDVGRRADFVADETEVRMAGELVDYGDPGPLEIAARRSQQTGQPLATWVDRVNLYSKLDRGVPRIRCQVAPEYVCTETDVEILSNSRAGIGTATGHAPWLGLMLNHTVDAERLNVLMHTLHVPVGLLEEIAAAAREDSILARLLSRQADSARPWLSGAVAMDHLLIGSAVLNGPAAEVAKLIAPYQTVLGFQLPADLSGLPQEPVSEKAMILLRNLRSLADSWNSPRGAALIARLSLELRLAPQEVASVLAPFTEFLPVEIPTDLSGLPARPPTDRERAILREISIRSTRSWDASAADLSSLAEDVRTIKEMATQWAAPISDAFWQRVRSLSPEQYNALEDADDRLTAQLAGLDEQDRRILSGHDETSIPWVTGTLSPFDIAQAAEANEETIAKTLERVDRLSRTYPISAPEIEWGDLLYAPLPALLDGVEDRAVEAADIIGIARGTGVSVAAILRLLKPIADALGLPSFDDHQLSRLEVKPDTFDLVAVAPIRDSPLRLDVLHVVRVAGRLGVSIGSITKRIEKFQLLLPEAPPVVTPEVEGHVPDWRDLVILTAEMDGRRLVTTEDIRNGHVERAAREAETTVEDVRVRLSRYAEYCGFSLEDG